ncbi:MAG TPA: type II toxin-antitoxin system VapB family antitoxin [Methylococcaceae bacterium]|nr:type II toxin-antitoxin system VapB family antitoxin [Methylococcaceae bacterium]
MTIARIFKSGNSQAVRLPKEYRFATAEVEIFRRGDEVVLREHKPSAADVFDLLASFPEDFMAEGRRDAPPQQREAL